MRFGETWSAGVVPEWESQYLDYIKGKKLIHKLERSKNPVGSLTKPTQSPRLPSPALLSNSYRQIDERSPLIANSQPNRTPVLSKLPESAIPLETLDSSTKVQIFLDWLDKEAQKVDKFYSEQEDAAIKRFDILKTELEMLGKHKSYHKQLHQSTQTPRAAHVFAAWDMPSLPNAVRRGGNDDQGKHSDSQAQDFSHSPISYAHAKRLLKSALLEYYQSIQHLRGYRSLNATAMRKINKKFDKTFEVKTLPQHDAEVSKKRFISSHTLDNLSKDVETLYADTFEHGNHKFAVEKLQSNPEKYPHNSEVLISGFLIGASLPLFLIALVTGIKKYETNHDWETRALLNVWACWLILALICLFFSLNILVWRKYRINYVFIFELNRYDHLDYREYPIMPSIFFFLMSLFAWLTFNVETLEFPSRYYPCIFVGIVVVGFLLPVGAMFSSARYWLQIAVLRLIFSGAFDVEFRDFFLGDIFCSLNYTLSNLSFFFCLYSTPNWWNDQPRSARCTSSQSRVLGFLNCLPGIWRCLQCLRRFLDTGAYFPHMFNACKYSFWILTNMFLSLARIDGTSTTWKRAYIVFASLNATYSALWDIIMDFSLGFNLRQERAYPLWSYYAIMIIDPILRFNWTLYIVYWNQKQQSDKVSFIVALIEIFRRFLWIFFRIENEHCANVTKFRAFKDVELPYHSADTSDADTPAQPVSIERRPTRTGTSDPSRTPRSISTSISQSPYIASMKRQIEMAHTTDFTRRKPTEDDIDEDDDDE